MLHANAYTLFKKRLTNVRVTLDMKMIELPTVILTRMASLKTS